jgi:fructokinase
MQADTQPRRHDIVCFGGLMVDLRGVEEATQIDQIETFRRSAGGAAFTVASMAARLGRPAAIIARIGDDPFGRFLRAEVRRLSIEDQWLQTDPANPTTLAFFGQAGTAGDFWVVRGADRHLVLDAAGRALVEQSSALHTTTFALSAEPCRTAAVAAIEAAHAAGAVVSLDPNYRAVVWQSADAFMPLLRHLLPLTTIIKPSLIDAGAIWGRGLTPGDYVERFHAHGARQVLLTLGREGVVASDGQRVERLPAIPVDAADTAGVGDAFTAGALTALVEQQDLFTAARVGMLVADYRLRRPEYSGPLPRWNVLLTQAKAGEESDTQALI